MVLKNISSKKEKKWNLAFQFTVDQNKTACQSCFHLKTVFIENPKYFLPSKTSFDGKKWIILIAQYFSLTHETSNAWCASCMRSVFQIRYYKSILHYVFFILICQDPHFESWLTHFLYYYHCAAKIAYNSNSFWQANNKGE